MNAPEYTTDQYLNALNKLMPKGRAWPKDDGSIQSKILLSLATTFSRLNARANNVIIDSFPQTTYELLTEWEDSLGIPDECAGLASTLQDRQSRVLVKFINNGGQTANYLINVASGLGHRIRIVEHTPSVAGRMRSGDWLKSQDWAFCFDVYSPLYSITYYRTGQSAAGEPLSDWGNDDLECSIRQVKPAHSIVRFIYSDDFFDTVKMLDTLEMLDGLEFV